MKEYTYLELCAGCGGLSKGLEDAGLKGIALYEIDKNCTNTLLENFPNSTIYNMNICDAKFKKI